MNTWELETNFYSDGGYYDPFEDMDDIEMGDNDYYDDFEERDYILMTKNGMTSRDKKPVVPIVG